MGDTAANSLGEPVFTSLALAANSVYIRSADSIYRIGKRRSFGIADVNRSLRLRRSGAGRRKSFAIRTEKRANGCK